MKNLPLKVLSIGIALVIFYFVNGHSNASVVSLVASIQVKNLPENKVILFPKVLQTIVTIRGPAFGVADVASNPPAFVIQLKEPIGSRERIILNKRLLSLTPTVEVVNIEPSEIELTLDDLESRVVPVVVPEIGPIDSADYKLESITVSPDKVNITGPKSELNGLDRLETDPVNIRHLTKSEVKQLSLRSPGPNTNLSENNVTVTINISSLQLERKFEKSSVEIRSKQVFSARIDPPLVNIEVTGPKHLIGKLQQKEVVPFVRLEGEEKIGQELVVRVDLPEEVSVVQITPEKVVYTGSVVAVKDKNSSNKERVEYSVK